MRVLRGKGNSDSIWAGIFGHDISQSFSYSLLILEFALGLRILDSWTYWTIIKVLMNLAGPMEWCMDGYFQVLITLALYHICKERSYY